MASVDSISLSKSMDKNEVGDFNRQQSVKSKIDDTGYEGNGEQKNLDDSTMQMIIIKDERQIIHSH